MKNKILLSFDIEEFDLPEEYNAEITELDKFEISGAGTRKILDCLKKNEVKATFFVTGKFAEHFPDLLKRMTDEGSEIASHGQDHSSFKPEDLAESKKILENLSKTEVTGFRMARLAQVAKNEITAAGYRYESSLNPVWLPGRYNNFRKPMLPFQEECGLWQFPVSALPGLRLPLFWLSFKNFPLYIYKLLTALTLRQTHIFNMYTHPWEYNINAKSAQWKIPDYITRHAGSQQVERLENLIKFLKKRGDFITFSEWLNLNEAQNDVKNKN